jgi:predicted anti-sigma-YlaC factor YlaD
MQVPFMISCRKATELTEKKLAGELTWTDNLRLLLHRSMCDACRRYGRQSQALDQLLKQKNEEISTGAKDATPDNALEEKILDKLKDL